MKQSHLSTTPTTDSGAQNAGQVGEPAVEYRVNAVFFAFAILAVVVAGAAILWGLVVLTLVALVAVPLVFVIFVALSWPYPSKG